MSDWQDSGPFPACGQNSAEKTHVDSPLARKKLALLISCLHLPRVHSFPPSTTRFVSPLHSPIPMDRVTSNDLENQSTILGSHASAKEVDETRRER